MPKPPRRKPSIDGWPNSLDESARRVRAIANRCPWTSAALAFNLGVDSSTLSRWITGSRMPDPEIQKLLILIEDKIEDQSKPW
jgi:DNA-binding transcriptional regulator YiaG